MFHKKELNPKYNPHIKKNKKNPHIKKHRKIHRHHRASVFWMSMLGCIVLIAAVGLGVFGIYHQAKSQARQNVAEKIQQNNRPQEPVYNQSSLQHKSDHNIDKQMVNQYAKTDHSFVKRISYNSKTDVARVELTKSAAKAFNDVSKSKRMPKEQLVKSIRTGVQIDDQLSSQAVEVTNEAHDGYFTFTFANAPQYQAPNTKTGDFKI